MGLCTIILSCELVERKIENERELMRLHLFVRFLGIELAQEHTFSG